MGHVRGCPTGDALPSLVGVVEDDESGRAALSSLIRSAGYMCAVFPSAEAFLAAGGFAGPHCMILDFHMPGLSGLELQSPAASDEIAHSCHFHHRALER